MKKRLLLLLCLPFIGLAQQQTFVPDANFEQALINLGYDTGTPNGSVPTTNIDTVTSLNVAGSWSVNGGITDLTQSLRDFVVKTVDSYIDTKQV